MEFKFLAAINLHEMEMKAEIMLITLGFCSGYVWEECEWCESEANEVKMQMWEELITVDLLSYSQVFLRLSIFFVKVDA